MTENKLMTLQVEVWCLLADNEGIHLISGTEAWRSESIPVDTDPHWVVQQILRENSALTAAKIIHSTSWRAEDESVILTYVAVLDCPNRWPNAQLVSAALPDFVGRPATHAANDAPTPRYIDVLLHALRHLRFLREHDATAAAAFSSAWREHLENFTPALAGMYSDRHSPETLPEIV